MANQKKLSIADQVKKHGGRLVTGTTMCDGADYTYRTVWDDDEQIDAFLDALPEGTVTRSQRTTEKRKPSDQFETMLTLFFSVRG